MDFFNDMSVPAKFLLAFIVVLAVLGAAGYLMRRFSGGALVTSGARGRQPRLGVIDAASVDGRRRLVLVRRDNVEHLLLIGGPTDIVVEPNIGRATAAAAPAATPLRDTKVSPALESLPRQPPPLEGSGWPPSEPAYMEPPPPPRPVRERQRLESLVEDVGAPPLTPPPEIEPAFQPPPAPPPYEPVFQIPPPPEPKRMPAAPPLPPRATQSEESNLAEMAQRLEAALRRPIKPVEPVPSPPPPGPRFTSAPAPLETPPRPSPREFAPPPAPPATAREPAAPAFPKEPVPELKVVPADMSARPAPAFTSIEEEMASLLGRSTGKP